LVDWLIGILVGGFNHLEKYESQWEGLSHILWNIQKNETTNQWYLPSGKLTWQWKITIFK
jgi:hypothetical protein